MRRVLVLWIFATILGTPVLRGQAIVTIAGDSVVDDGRAATAAGLRYPTAAVSDAAGNIFIADSNNNRVRRVDGKSGLITTVAGTGFAAFNGDDQRAVDSDLHTPTSLALEREHSLLIVDSGNARVRRVDLQSGRISTVAGGGGDEAVDGPATAARLLFPVLSGLSPGLAVEADGAFLVSEPGRHVIRRVSRDGRITTVAGTAGTEGFAGDGGAALSAQLSQPTAIALDGSGNIFVADTGNNCIRRIDKRTGTISTIAGTPLLSNPPTGDGVATGIGLARPRGVAIDSAGAIYIADSDARRIRRIVDGVMTAIAGTGATGPTNDGSAPLAANFARPESLFVDAQQNLLVADPFDYRVRRITPQNVISTVAGNGNGGYIGDGGPATAAGLFSPFYVALDPQGNIVFSDRLNQRIRRIDRTTGIISTVAGNGDGGYVGTFSGDGGPATRAGINRPLGVTVDNGGNIFISDTQNHRIRRVDAATGEITTVAGNGLPDPPDNGAAKDVGVSFPRGLFVDAKGLIYVATPSHSVIRRIDLKENTVTSVACCFKAPTDVRLTPSGDLLVADPQDHRVVRFDVKTQQVKPFAGGVEGFSGDGGPAEAAQLRSPSGLALDAAGNVFIADTGNRRIRKVSAENGIITTIAGGGTSGSGDNGPAVNAQIAEPINVAVAANGDLFFPDSSGNRIRAVYACSSVTAPVLRGPADGLTTVGTSVDLAWSAVDRASRYDVYLATEAAASTIVAADLTATAFTPSNLQPGTKYYWRVVAKGDRFCDPTASATSSVREFTVTPACSRPGNFDVIPPASAPAQQGITLTWSAAQGASRYDVLFGATNPPPVIATVSGTTYRTGPLAAGSSYFFSVVARAGCDDTLTTQSGTISYRAAGVCSAVGAFSARRPADGARGVGTTVLLEWSAASQASKYDVYLGTTTPPPAYVLDISGTALSVSGLSPGQTYYWKVAARSGCEGSSAEVTSVSSFSTGDACERPSATVFTVTPPSEVAAGQTYVLAWRDATQLAPDGYYVVDRSRSESFATLVDSQQTQSTSASFVAGEPGAYFHRVRAVNPCSAADSVTSQASRVSVVAASPNVVFSVQPEAILTSLGEQLEGRRSRFVLENIGTERVSVFVTEREIDSVPFFTVVDPAGGDSLIVALEPRRPKELEIRFAGPPNDKEGSYQGIIVVTSTSRGLAVTPYAFVNLRVGARPTVTPEFRIQGAAVEYAAFPGFDGEDKARGPIAVDIHNPGSTPMDVAAEIGPELWLVPETGWSDTAIPPGASRRVRLFARRAFAPDGSALPRYTYFTVRTKSGQSARLLVQDNGLPPKGSGRGAAVDPSLRSSIVPEVVTGAAASHVRITNLGPQNATAELLFTPEGVDGLDAARVLRAAVVVPSNDVVALTDPLSQLWSLAAPVRGQLEIRAGGGRIGALSVRAGVTRTSAGGGSRGYTIPVIARGDGARAGSPHHITGISVDPDQQVGLVFAETTGADRAALQVRLINAEGDVAGARSYELPRYGSLFIDDLLGTFTSMTSISGARVEISVSEGAGAVTTLAKIVGRASGGGATLVSAPLLDTVGPSGSQSRSTHATATRKLIVPSVASGPVAQGSSQTYATVVDLAAGLEPANFNLVYRTSQGEKTASVTVMPRKTVTYRNVVEQLFGIGSASRIEGTLYIETSIAGRVAAQLTSSGPGVDKASLRVTLPVVADASETVTGPDSQRPLYIDGLDQSTDPARGGRWSLLLSEITGKPATLLVSIYEAGNRSAPIAFSEITVPPFASVRYDNLFAEVGLDNAMRRKDRTNMLLAVVHRSGPGAALATATTTDNRSGDSKVFILGPVNAGAVNVQKATAVGTAPKSTRRRAVTP